MVDIKALREQLKKEQTTTPTTQQDNAGYPFWNIDNGKQAVIRFLPDNDPDNMYFWKERAMINLEFDGVIGHDTNGPVKVQVPSMEMYGDTCPILQEARRFYKEGRDELGQKYWKKRSYVFQGIVRENPLNEDNVPENPIRRLVLNPSIYKIVYQYLLDDDNEYAPTDYENGCDFRINKTQNGSYAEYTTSNFSRKNSSLNEDELSAIDTYGLFTLSNFLPNKPDSDQLRVIQEMFEASLDGEPYDPSRFARYYKPYGFDFGDVNAASNNKPVVNDDEDIPAPVQKSSPVVEKSDETENRRPSPQELLAKLKKNQS